MASANLDDAEAQWRAQFEAMKSALAGLKLPSEPPSDVDFDDEYEGYSSGSGAQDVWDFISDDEDDDYSSDQLDGHGVTGGDARYGAAWFAGKCSAIAAKNGLADDVFQNQILSVLTSGQGDEELQSQLADLIGFDDFDFIIELLGHRDDVVTAATSEVPQESKGRLLTKAQREEALRQQDHQHKNASLAPAMTREVQYPHVYKAYNAGNSLSHSGKKYALPNGSERLLFDKYEEYAIPAGKKGVLGPGQKL
ncbi:activating signal cointegrator 1 complex subunit 3, partial [Colletotrichum higginsianum]